MRNYDSLSDSNKKLYNELSNEIKNNNLDAVLNRVVECKRDGSYTEQDLCDVFSVHDKKGNTLIIDVIDKNVKTAAVIYRNIVLSESYTQCEYYKHAYYIANDLKNKVLDMILKDQGKSDIVEKVIEFSKIIWPSIFIETRLRDEFKQAIQNGNFDDAGKFFKYDMENNTLSLKIFFMGCDWVYEPIQEIKEKGSTKFLENVLEFAKKHNFLEEFVYANFYGGNEYIDLSEYAKALGVEQQVKKIIDQYEQKSGFLNKVSEHKGKFAVCTLLLFGSATAFILEQFIIGGVIGAIGALAILVSLTMTTEKGKKIQDKVSNSLSNLFVSEQSQKDIELC
ncbi:hypothetical protein [Wolbachia endosymbiont of Pentidionis agamae]|uniref:hypothetical protein n=1 Tax=Wolbachia endosymbiont of Pentidionis agamae TaxID=3110435 RepID=UPI002FCEDC90